MNLKTQLINGTKDFVQQKLFQLQNFKNEFNNSTQKILIEKKNLLKNWNTILKLSHPNEILKKGFAIVYQNNLVVVEKKNLRVGKVTVKLKDGEIVLNN
jgi:exonuclease VII large subunit